MVHTTYSTTFMGEEEVKYITRIELLTIRDALRAALEEEDMDGEAICDALDIVEALLLQEEVEHDGEDYVHQEEQV